MVEETAATEDQLDLAGRLSSPVLVGREAELDVLVQAVRRGRGVVFVEGEAGVGKTRLVEEVLAASGGSSRRVFVGRCHPLSESLPLAPVLEALREAAPDRSALTPVVGALRPLLPELAKSLPPALPPLADERAERHRAFRALHDLLVAHGRLVLVLEDLHWSDPITLDFLRFLLPQLPPKLTILGTYRGGEVSARSLGALADPRDAPLTKVTLAPLDEHEVREVVLGILESPSVSDEFLRYLFEWTAGIPFAVEELLLFLQQRHEVVRQRGVWVRHELELLEVPDRLRDAILERLRALPPDARAVVEAAAALGLPADEPLLTAVADLDEERTARGLIDALSAALLFEHGERRYALRHPLARQAVEGGIAPPLARQLHARAARALERAKPQPVARIAHHYKAAGEPRKWVRYAEAAADVAVSLDDHATAYTLMSEAVALQEIPLRTRGRLGARLLRHAHRCRVYQDAIDAVQELIDDQRMPPSTRGELRLGVGRLLGEVGDRDAAMRLLAQAVDDLRDRPDLALGPLGLLAEAAETPAERQRWRDATLDAADAAARSGDRKIRITAASVRAWVLLRSGDSRGWDAVEQIPEPGRAPAELMRASIGYGNAADTAVHLGYYERAEKLTARAFEFVERHEFPTERACLELTKLQLDWCRGRWAGLDVQLREKIDRAENWPRGQSEARVVLGLLSSARGDVRSATEILESQSVRFDGDLPVALWLAGGLIRLRLPSPATAVAEARRALDTLGRSGAWILAGDVVPAAIDALLVAGERAEAEAAVAAFADGIQGCDAPAAAAALESARASLIAARDPRQAARAYLAAARAWHRLPRPYEAVRARARAGRLLLAVRPAFGQRLLLDALDVFHELGAARSEEAVRRDLREQGLLAPHRRGRKGYGMSLSPRERQIASLAAEGMTNRDIAQALFLSVKTVEGHLRSVLRKLEVSRRTEIAQALAAPGGAPPAGPS